MYIMKKRKIVHQFYNHQISLLFYA